jgi:Tfp pilus assembly protein PilO
MAMNFSELSGLKQWGAVIAGGAVVTAALFFTVFKSQNDKNASAQHALQDKIRENNELESYRPKLKDMERQLANLKQQLEIERRIVPDDKQVDNFIETLDAEAQKANVELRRSAREGQRVLLRGPVRHGSGRALLRRAQFL